MYAIVDIAGQQFKVEKDKKVFVHRLEGKEGSKVEFDQVLLIDNDKDVTVGTPVITGAMVTATIVEHLKGDKVIVFKKKRRKGYKKKNGHRQYLTQIQVEDIIEKGAKPKAAEKKTAEKKEAEPAPKAETKVTESKEEGSVPKATPKKAAATSQKAETADKKPAAKKTAGTKAAAGKTAAKKSTASSKATEKKEDKQKEE